MLVNVIGEEYHTYHNTELGKVPPFELEATIVAITMIRSIQEQFIAYHLKPSGMLQTIKQNKRGYDSDEASNLCDALNSIDEHTLHY